MLNQLNTTTKRELDAKYLTEANTYLYTEQKVGKFADEDLYQLTIYCGLLGNSEAKIIDTQVIVGDIISIDGVARSATNIIKIPHVGTGSGDGNVALNLNKNTNNQLSIIITSNSDRTNYYGYVTIQYTKPTQS